MTASPRHVLGGGVVTPFRLRRDGDRLVVQEPSAYGDDIWRTVITLDRVFAANLAAELDHWLAGTDQIPEVDR